MYEGFLIIGEGQLDGPNFEIINNARAYAYACNAGMTWLEECNICLEASSVLPQGPDYNSPASDGAPWYDESDPDSEGFLGVMGLSVSGAEDSTRTATVVSAATGGGVISSLNFKPRTMVAKVLAMATDECSLEFGLNWLRCQYQASTDDCLGDVMTFFDCCPCVCINDEGLSDVCWIDRYREIPAGPESCTVDWWPTTYAELRDGPPIDVSETWCSWLKNYRQLATTGPPGWACCVEQCVVPYLRQFHNVRIIAGPKVLRRKQMNSRGWIAEVEFIIVAADPAEYGMPDTVTRLLSTDSTGSPHDDPVEPPPPPDPFGIPGWTTPRSAYIGAPVSTPGLPTSWTRETHAVTAEPRVAGMGSLVMRFEVTALEAHQGTRIGVWHDGALVDGIYVPPMVAGSSVVVDGAKRRVSVVDPLGHSRALTGFARAFSGSAHADWPTVPPGIIELTVDRAPADAGRVRVEVFAAAKGCA